MPQEQEQKEPATEVVEQPERETQEAPEQKRMVPLEALEAERMKRQESEYRARMYEEQFLKTSQKEEPSNDHDDLVTKGALKNALKEMSTSAKREILEQAFCDANPSAVSEINAYLPELMKNKTWVKEAVENAPNRWARAWEIVQDLKPRSDSKAAVEKASQRMDDNSKKPGSPVAIAKSAQHSKVDMLKGMAGKKDFTEWRRKMLRGEN